MEHGTNKMILDVTTTAMPRPGVLDQTYKSFTTMIKNVEWKDSTCYINIDPLDNGIDRKEVVKVAEKYFGKVVARMPKIASSSSACKWLWMQPQNRFFFNLEDDWICNEEIDGNDLFSGLDKRHVIAVPLRAYSYSYKNCPMSPSVYRASFFRDVADYMNEVHNPETQLHDYIDRVFFKYVRKRKYMIRVYPFGVNRLVISDIGREWMNKSDYTRPQLFNKGDDRYLKKCHFVSWVRKD